MKRRIKLIHLILLFTALGCSDIVKVEVSDQQDELMIRQIHTDYVNEWKNMDEEKIMGLLEEESMIQPNMLSPIEGKERIREFWFPNDGSITTINTFETEIISLKVMDTIAVTTHSTLMLDWNYLKDSINMGMIQKGFNTTVYRRQMDNSWKIWKSMWTDIYVKRK